MMNYLYTLCILIASCTSYAVHTIDQLAPPVDWFTEYKREFHKQYTLAEERSAYKLLDSRRTDIQRTHVDGVTLKLHADSDKNFTKAGPIKRRRRWTEWYSGKLRSQSPPSSFDWRTHHYVTSPRRQGSCGGCFAFAATEHLEFWHKKKTGRLKKLSVQQALDCSAPESDGCDGGLMEDVYYHSYWNPIGPEEFDAWTGRDGRCKTRRTHPYVRVNTYESMSDEYGDPVEAHLAHNVYHYGPIPVGISSASNTFEHYHRGIIRKEHCGSEVDHAVLVVGYTPTYWVIKNSWGTSWGDGGYARIERGRNACGINSYASFATDVSV